MLWEYYWYSAQWHHSFMRYQRFFLFFIGGWWWCVSVSIACLLRNGHQCWRKCSLCFSYSLFPSVLSLIWVEDSCLCDSVIHHVTELSQLPITLKLKKRTPVFPGLSPALLSSLVCWTATQIVPCSQILRKQYGRGTKMWMERRVGAAYATTSAEKLVKLTLWRT